MHTQRLSIDFPADDYIYLKMLCAEKRISLNDFLVPVILKAIDDEMWIFVNNYCAAKNSCD